MILIVYVFVGPHLPGDFATRPVTPERLLVYLGLDINGMIGPLLGVAILIVVPFTLMGQVLGRTGGAAYFADIAMSGMGHFRRRRRQDRSRGLGAVRALPIRANRD